MGSKLGLECKLYRNTGTYAVPVWSELSHVKDVALNLEKGEADVTTRANQGWKASKAALKDASIEFDIMWDTSDLGFVALKDAFMNNTTLEVAVMDGPIATVGSEGLRATVEVMKFPRNEPLEEAVTASVALKPTYAEHPPEWMKVAA